MVEKNVCLLPRNVLFSSRHDNFSSRSEDLIRAYPWGKQNLINDWENIIEESEQESQQGKVLANKYGLFQKTAGWFGVVAAVQR